MPETLKIGGWTVEVDRSARTVQLHDTAGRKRLVACLDDRPMPNRVAGGCWTCQEGGLLTLPEYCFDRFGNELAPEPEPGKWAWLVDLMRQAGLELPEEGN